MLRRTFLGLLAAVALFSGVFLTPLASYADEVVCDPITLECYTIIDQPGTDPVSNPDPTTGFTPGATVCSYLNPEGQNVKVDCSTSDGYWNNNRQCYVKLNADQPPSPPGGDAAGAWYLCTFIAGPWGGDLTGYTFWSDTPPPGVNTLSPNQAAQRLVETFQIRGVEIGFAPNPNIPGSKSYVGVPIWMWVTNPTPLTYGPYTQTATLGGVTITATARVTSILWNMGDGTTVPCGSAGTEFRVAFGAIDSPTCGYRYSTTSDDEPGGRFAVTATSQWSVTWAGGGQSGTIPLTATSGSTVDINELQAVNVKN